MERGVSRSPLRRTFKALLVGEMSAAYRCGERFFSALRQEARARLLLLAVVDSTSGYVSEFQFFAEPTEYYIQYLTSAYIHASTRSVLFVFVFV